MPTQSSLIWVPGLFPATCSYAVPYKPSRHHNLFQIYIYIYIFIYLFPRACYMPRLSKSIRFYQYNNIWWTLQIMMFLFMQFFLILLLLLHPPSRSILLGPQFSNPLSQCYSLSGTQQVSRRRLEFNHLFILIFVYFILKGRQKKFWNDSKKEFAKHYVPFISYGLKFCCINLSKAYRSRDAPPV